MYGGPAALDFSSAAAPAYFRDTSPGALVDHLIAVRTVLADEGPVAAYNAMHDGGAHRIKWMAASFFTKFLHAADTPDGSSCGRALILDQLVVAALNLDPPTILRC